MVGYSLKFDNEYKKYTEIGLLCFVFQTESQQVDAITNQKKKNIIIAEK